jgi:hypothetical protein
LALLAWTAPWHAGRPRPALRRHGGGRSSGGAAVAAVLSDPGATAGR